MKKLLSYLTIPLLMSCSFFEEEINFEELGFGVCEATTTEMIKSDASPSGFQIRAKDFQLIKQTDRIPGQLGLTFGLQYHLETKETKEVIIEKVWSFPEEIIGKNGKKFKEIRREIKVPTNKTSFTIYQFEEEFEIIKGEWKLELFHDGNRLYQRIFNVI